MLNKVSNWLIELGIVLGILLVILLAEWLGLVQPLTVHLEKVAQPAIVKISKVTGRFSNPWFKLSKIFNSARRVQDLEAEYTQSLARISELEYLEKENQELRRLLETQEKTLPLVITAPIVSQGQPSISAGKADGVRAGQPVLASGMLVGLIKSSSTHQATISLLFQNQDKPILVTTESGVDGLVIGDGRNILLTEITKEADLVVGERVITLGQEQIRPHLFVGQIQQIVDQPSAPIKEAILTQETSFYEASIVEVLP